VDLVAGKEGSNTQFHLDIGKRPTTDSSESEILIDRGQVAERFGRFRPREVLVTVLRGAK
jgi:hypothetical protein